MTDDFAEFLRFARTGLIVGKTFRFNEPIFLGADLSFQMRYCNLLFGGMPPGKGEAWLTIDKTARIRAEFCNIQVTSLLDNYIIRYLPGAVRVNH